jgi:HEAT repeat protein
MSQRAQSQLRQLAADAAPYVRANAILGLAWLRDSASTQVFVERLRSDRSPWARINALRALQLVSPPQVELSEKRVLKQMSKVVEVIAAEDPDPRVRALAVRLSRPDAQQEGNWIGLYLMTQEDSPLRSSPFVLITAMGLARAGTSDGLGEAWEEGMSDGLCFVELPPPEQPTEPNP